MNCDVVTNDSLEHENSRILIICSFKLPVFQESFKCYILQSLINSFNWSSLSLNVALACNDDDFKEKCFMLLGGARPKIW